MGEYLLTHAGWCMAVLTLLVGIVWASTIRPFDAPDEPSHLLAVMQVRVKHILPEVHFDYRNNPKGELANTYVDPGVIKYARASGIRFEYLLSRSSRCNPHSTMWQPVSWLKSCPPNRSTRFMRAGSWRCYSVL